jgi:hypothetical protein
MTIIDALIYLHKNPTEARACCLQHSDYQAQDGEPTPDQLMMTARWLVDNRQEITP